MSGRKPHQIHHDHKLQSQGDFGKISGGKKRPVSDQGTVKRKKEGVFSGNDSTLAASSDGRSSGLDNPPKKSGAKPTKPRRTWLWIICILCGLGALGATAAIAVIHQMKNTSPGTVVVSNSTATNTTTLLSAQSATTTGTLSLTTTRTPTPTTVTTAQTTLVSSAPQPTATTTNVEGFDVFQFNNGDIMLVYESKGSIWTKQFANGSWTSPVEIASDAKDGTTVCVQGSVTVVDADSYYDSWDDEYAYGLTMWSVYYVDTKSVVQEMRLDLSQSYYTTDYEDSLPPSDSNSWYSGDLGSYSYKVSNTSYIQACAWGPLTNSETAATNYLYFDAAGGGITKLGFDSDSSSWIELLDLPAPVSVSNKAIMCAVRGDGIESLWLVNEKGDLEQWWLDVNNTENPYYTTSTADIWTQGMSIITPLHPNTSLASWSSSLSDVLFYQAANKTLMHITIHGEAANTTLFTVGPVAPPSVDPPSPGSSLKTGGVWNSDIAPFYVYFQNGAKLMQQTMTPNNDTGDALAGTLTAVDGVELVKGNGSGPRKVSWLLVWVAVVLGVCLVG